MVNIGWITVSIGTAVLIAVAAIVMFQRNLRGKKSGFPLQKERTISQELTTLGGSLVVLGIVFGTDRLIAYSFIGAGVLLSVISLIKSRMKRKRIFHGDQVN